MKRVLILFLILGLLSGCCTASAETASEDVWFTVSVLPREGDRSITLRLVTDYTELQAGAFVNGENLTGTVSISEHSMTISLLRPLKEGETVIIAAEGKNGDQALTLKEREITVSPRFQPKLTALRQRVDQMWDIWSGSWLQTLARGSVYFPTIWKELPFVTWADEAPEIQVQEADNRVYVYLREALDAGWRICLGYDMPVVYTDCVWDEDSGAYVAGGEYDSVWLISDMENERIGISIRYRKEDGFLPSYPVLEWSVEDNETGMAGFGCYGWGTTRSFTGGMYIAVYQSSLAYSAEYDAEGALLNYTDLLTDCVYSNTDELISGTEPEGFVNPVIH